MNNPKNRTLTIERTLDAPLDLVWDAWTKPEHIAKWWGVNGMETKIVEHEFTVGGQWKYAMTMPDGREFSADGVYIEIVPKERIITSANFKPMTEGVEIQTIFKADGDKTQLTFNCVHETEEYCKQQEEMGFYNGWGSFFDRLSEYVSPI